MIKSRLQATVNAAAFFGGATPCRFGTPFYFN
jgi:hypothetical protein